jgi:hypothetical protein
MTAKSDFNADDWQVLANGPLLAGLCVIAADRGGTLREAATMSRIYQQTAAQKGVNPLLDEIVATPANVDRAAIDRTEGGLPRAATETLRRAITILEGAATRAEVDSYKTFVMTVAQAVAQAHKEGGFLGIGGTPVSDAENAMLDQLSTALGPPPEGARTASDG